MKTGTRTSSEVRAILEPQIIVALDGERPFEWPSRHLLGDVDRVHVTRALSRDARRGQEGSASSLTLALADRLVAKDAALLHRMGASRWVVVAGAGQALRVNGVAVERTSLHDGDLIEIGRTLLMFRNTVPPAHRDTVDLEGPAAAGATGLPTFVAALADVHATVERVASTPAPVLVRGASGTGKQMVARALHTLSRRRGPLVNLLGGGASELLAADGGTLLVTAPETLPPARQAALVTALARGAVVPAGATRAIPFDARLVAIANGPLEAEVAAGRLRADLHALFTGPTLHLPRLAERREDLGLLVAGILRRKGSAMHLEPDAALALFRHAWVGNVRQLERHLCQLAAGGERAGGASRYRPAAAANE
jgi:transcriptional regulator of acetoin/glycerol metabolism